MKFLHAADLHLDSPLRGLARHDGAPLDQLRGATRKAFNNLVELAIEEKVAFVLLAGDLYDGTWHDSSTAIFLAKKLGELERAGIRVFAVLGNHDVQSKLTKALGKPNNLTLFPADKPRTELLAEFQVAIHGQSFAEQQVFDNLALGFPAAKPGLFNIGLLHTSLDGREGHAPYAPCKFDDLRLKDYQYWALGHVHAFEIVGTEPWVVFPGCLQGRHVRETGPKGCCLVSVEDGQVKKVEPRVLDVVRWANCELDLGPVHSMPALWDCARKALRQLVDGAAERTFVARIRFHGATPVHEGLQGKGQQLRQQLLELAAELHEDRLWIEKVVIATTSKRESVLAGQGALGGLARSIQAVATEPSAIRGLDTALAALKEKLPSEVLFADDGLRLDQPAVLARLIQEAKELLLCKLLESGAES